VKKEIAKKTQRRKTEKGVFYGYSQLAAAEKASLSEILNKATASGPNGKGKTLFKPVLQQLLGDIQLSLSPIKPN